MPKTINYQNEIKKFFYLVLGCSAATLMTFIFLVMYQGYQMSAGDYAQLILGSIIFGAAFPCFILSFIVHYYGKEIDSKSDKLLFISMVGGGVLTLLGLLLLTNGIAEHLIYPMVNGLNFKVGFVTPADKMRLLDGNPITPNLAWYAICILSGALLVYFVCDHRFYKEYGKHGILESTFLVSFPAGIIGARIGFVIGEWNTKFAGQAWWKPFAIWEGGLTIVSGAIIGIVVGVAWFLWRNKKYSIWVAVDIIVPCILLAQAVGRWGNFFNAEVHGNVVDASNYWWLPKIVLLNSQYSEGVANVWSHTSGYTNGTFMWSSNPSQIYVPLFYIEFLTNLLGYFVIRFLVGKCLKKYTEMGDLCFLYVLWYGLTRVFMEPLRHPVYNMGADGYWSWMWSIIFALGSALLILINHAVRYFYRKKKNLPMIAKINTPFTISVISISGAIGLALLIVGSIFMSTSVQSAFIGFNRYNNGFIILTMGLVVILFAIVAIFYLLQKKHKVEEVVE